MKTECAAPTPAIQKELVRLLYLEHGHQRASEISGVGYDLVRKWASLGKWRNLHKPSQTPVQRAADHVASELQEHEHETRLSLARANRRHARDCEELDVKHARTVQTVAQTMAIVHRQDEQKPGAQFSLNVLNLNMFSDDSTPTLDE